MRAKAKSGGGLLRVRSRARGAQPTSVSARRSDPVRSIRAVYGVGRALSLVPMHISLKWLNRYLSPANLSADEADRLLTQAGFPIESREAVGSGDTMLDVEVTSNRGDCLSHIGCAREVAAMRGGSVKRSLVMPDVRAAEHRGLVGEVLRLENRESGHCPLFTARVIRGCRVGASPAWLVEALEAVGQRSINNVVDVTNFITFEFGNPCHVFDLKKLAGGALVIRFAKPGEKLVTLDGKERTLVERDLVVADAEKATSLAGVIGGQTSEVDGGTTDVVFEMATWDPVTVRTAARRLGIRTDAGYRFERGVHPATIEAAAERAVALICELTGGVACSGVLSAGASMPEPVVVMMRPSRVERIAGVEVPAGDMIGVLRDLEFDVTQEGDDALRCVVPPHRLDVTREIDLVEEIARARGLEAVPTLERLAVKPRSLQNSERAVREAGSILTGLGFFETVTFTFVGRSEADVFLERGTERVEVDDERRKAEPVLRPSVLAGLLGCRRANRDGGVEQAGGIRLFELGSSFAQTPAGESLERRTLAMMMDVPKAKRKHSDDELRKGVRLMRGAVDAVVRAMHGRLPDVEAIEPMSVAWRGGALGRVTVQDAGGRLIEIGRLGLLSDEALRLYDLDVSAVAAELWVEPLISAYPPAALAARLPQYPGIARDVSLVLDEAVRWSQVEALVRSLNIDRLEGVEFVGTFRGEQIGRGRKSMTVRLEFRDEARTMRHEEVDGELERVVENARTRLGAEIRA